jgi:hypothetical protein
LSIVTNYFDGNTYTGANDREAWDNIQSDGVISSSDFLVSENSPADLSVDVAAGVAFRGGYFINSDAVENVAITANTSGFNRIDLIVLNIDTVAKATIVIAVAGVASGSPVAPTPTATQLKLAEVLVGNGAAVINDNVITDRRPVSIHKSVTNPNLFINGDFEICQRGTSQTSSGYGSDDRWINLHNGTTKTHTQQAFTVGQTDVPGNPTYYSRTVVTSSAGAGNYCIKSQRIENVASVSGEAATLSFWAKADASKNIAIELYQNFGSGGSTAVSAIGSQLVALTTSWQKFEITVDVPSVSGKTIGADNYLGVFIWFDAGSTYATRTASLGQQSGTFELSRAKLESGATATNFVPRLLAETKALCARFYQKSYNYADAPGTSTSTGIVYEPGTRNSASIAIGTKFECEMRTDPTVTLYSTDGTAASVYNDSTKAATVTGATTKGIRYVGITSGGSTNSVSYQWTADAELGV